MHQAKTARRDLHHLFCGDGFFSIVTPLNDRKRPTQHIDPGEPWVSTHRGFRVIDGCRLEIDDLQK